MKISRRNFALAVVATTGIAAVIPGTASVLAGPPQKKNWRPLVGMSPEGWIVNDEGRRIVVQHQRGMHAMIQLDGEWAEICHITDTGVVYSDSGNQGNPDVSWLCDHEAILVV
jgi:hypothetical protein